MRDMIIIGGIVLFWFLMTLGITAIANDPLMQQVSQSGNTSFLIDANTDNINFTSETVSPETSNPISYVQMLFRIFTFRVPEILNAPVLVGVIISFVNYFLVLVLGILLYRLLIFGGG